MELAERYGDIIIGNGETHNLDESRWARAVTSPTKWFRLEERCRSWFIVHIFHHDLQYGIHVAACVYINI